MKRWQYKVITSDMMGLLTEEDLNKLGQAGWELRIAVYLPVCHAMQYFFKRPIYVNEERDE